MVQDYERVVIFRLGRILGGGARFSSSNLWNIFLHFHYVLKGVLAYSLCSPAQIYLRSLTCGWVFCISRQKQHQYEDHLRCKTSRCLPKRWSPRTASPCMSTPSCTTRSSPISTLSNQPTGGGPGEGRDQCWRLQRLCSGSCGNDFEESSVVVVMVVVPVVVVILLFVLSSIFQSFNMKISSFDRNVLGTRSLGEILSDRVSLISKDWMQP